MIRITVSRLIVLFMIASHASIASQIEAQELCVQQTVAACMNQCEKTNDIACSEACQENAQNQCIQAGE